MEVLMSPAISGSTYRGATIGLDADGELIVTYNEYDHRGVSSINFRIQCIKIKDPQLLQTTSAYNTYRLGYGEIAITDEFGEVETILGAATLLEVIEQLFSSL